ncbi:methyl-accepting chemotaxis protein [Maridesulfovibrio sp. FT414]|uniref:methyl-accepting chemotaxis protein n=1 Tax=Maridesulfovibrio sp. FT414 TaxID=2979469 RepID=UPI003D800A54
MLKDIKIRTKLLLILGINIVLLVIMGVVAVMSAKSINGALEQVFSRDLQGMVFLLEADRDLHQALIAERTMIYAKPGTETFSKQQDDYTSNKQQADTRVGKFAKTSNNPDQQQLVKKYEADRKRWDEVSIKLWQDKQAGAGIEELSPISLGEGMKRFDTMREHINVLTEALQSQAEQAQKKAEQSYASLSTIIAFLTIGSAIIGALCTLIVTGNITVPLRKVVDCAEQLAAGDYPQAMRMARRDEVGVLADSFDEMNATLKRNMLEIEAKSREAQEKADAAEKAMLEAEKARSAAERAKKEGMNQAAGQLEQIVSRIASASDELNGQIQESRRGCDAQRNRTSEAATAMEEMNATVLEVAGNASHAAENAKKASEQAHDGGELVETVVSSIEALNKESKELYSEMGELGQKAESIGQVMGVISDIADQTNLLALNAAIEAARAGDAGRGFAVVADEVRKLAEKTMAATDEVGNAIRSIQGSARKSVQSVEKTSDMVGKSTELSRQAGQFLIKIQEYVGETADQVRAIATAAEQQSASSEEINRTTDEINTIASDIAEAMAQSAHAMDDMAQLSEQLRRLIDELKS